MTDHLKIDCPEIGPIVEGASDVVATDLNRDELRTCFPADVTMRCGPKQFKFVDVAVLGLVMDLSEIWENVQAGRRCADVIDFYGEYHLALRVEGQRVTLQDQFSDMEFVCDSGEFSSSTRSWVASVFVALENRYPRILDNPGYPRLKAYVWGVWK